MSTRVDLSTRFSVLIKAALNSGQGQILNLSEGGAYVATKMLLLPQAVVKLRVSLPREDRWLDLEGVVTWENRGANRKLAHPPGYGLRFTRIPGESRDQLRRIVRGALPDNSAESPHIESLESSDGPSRPKSAKSPESTNQAPPAVATPIVRSDTSPALSVGFAEETEAAPYRLTREAVASRVPSEGSGVFVLYFNRAQEARVGRADRDPRAALLPFVGEYGFFWFESVLGVEETYRRECQLFHHFGGERGQLDVIDHPIPPAGLAEPACGECGANAVSS